MANSKPKYGSTHHTYRHGRYYSLKNLDQNMSVSSESREESTTINVSKDNLKHLLLREVKLTSHVLGQGSFSTVYKAELYDGTACAAKQLDIQNPHQHFTISSQQIIAERLEQHFLQECINHSKLDHPNIVKMLGVFYPTEQPILLMELMEYNLTQLLNKYSDISMYMKISILQDVSRGLRYLHEQNPPIVHQALYSDNILFTKGLTAKIGDFKTGEKTVSDQHILSVRRNRDFDFLPECTMNLKYATSLNVFSFGCIVCHVITQKWPSIQSPLPDETYPKRSGTDLIPSCMRDDWSVDKHQEYIDLISDCSLRKLVEACLQIKPKNRPNIVQIDDSITFIMKREYML